MIDTYDEHNPWHPANQKEVEMYTEEQLLLEQIDTLETRLNEAVRSKLWLIDQLKTLAALHRMESSFGGLTIDEQKQKIEILKRYENEAI
jgi:hypothetical protein